ncbi:choice-of-anchor L domain-containing protein [Leptobacterium sp. I13]|uniref:choice-of-anchor L domain-containing protein n=1 Tax=Leptobacterium meishanense TaxID=3128904 RepID=UPI0030ED5EE4
MKFKQLCVLFLFLAGYAYSQQVVIDDSFTPEQLIRDVLIQGDCVEVTNINSPINGSLNDINSFGFFERGTSNIPFENGIIITSGNVNDAGAPIQIDDLSQGNNDWGTDTDLENVLGIDNTFNATVIEFDFISAFNTVSFNYILASEEYFSFFPCQYSDNFAFLIRPADNSAPYTNIAVVPGTNIPVGTDTIHDEVDGVCAAENEQFFEGFNLGDTNYNGRTTTLTASTNIVPNQQYHIKLIVADGRDTNFDSAIFIEGNSFDTSVDLGNDIQTCNDQVVLSGDIGNPNAIYEWFFNGNSIPGENNSSILATASGAYTIRVNIPINNNICTAEDTINVALSVPQNIPNIEDFELCDLPPYDQTEIFDLSIKDDEILNSLPFSNYIISYHFSEEDANTNSNAIEDPIENTATLQTIYVRIEDTNNGCISFGTFNLVVPVIEFQQPQAFPTICGLFNAPVVVLDLVTLAEEIANENTELIVQFHILEEDALNTTNPIRDPIYEVFFSQSVYVSIWDPNTDCVRVTSLDFTITDPPPIQEETYIDACDEDHDGFAEFDMTDATQFILSGLIGMNVSHHLSFGDAENNTNPIQNITNFENTVPDVQFIYLRVEDPNTNCFSIAVIELHTNYLITGTGDGYNNCFDTDGDGIAEFNMDVVTSTITDADPDIDITYYLTPEDRENEVNPINENIPFYNTTNPQTLYIVLTSPTCREEKEIALQTHLSIEIGGVPNQVYACDANPEEGVIVDTSEFDDIFTLKEGQTVSYHYSELNADSGNLPISGPFVIYEPVIIYAAVRGGDGACVATTSFTINFSEPPETNPLTPLAACDDDMDGSIVVDLTSKEPQVIDNDTNIAFSYHTSQQDANDGSNPISNPTIYESTGETVYIRVESTVTRCFSTEVLGIIAIPPPTTIAVSEFQECETDGDGIESFELYTKDNEILNGQPDTFVEYYRNENDANNRTNSINKFSQFQNTSNPQTIYYRINSSFNTGCFAVGSFDLVVNDLPVYTIPTDISICDDISNDRIEIFDLQTKIDEITLNSVEPLTISFHTSIPEADSGTNPLDLNYSNTENPQTIYARIENNIGCFAVETFEVNVVEPPISDQPEPIVVCDTDLDGIMLFDLTTIEPTILNPRQNDIAIGYFFSEDDALNNINEINDPANFTNSEDQQTVYIKAINNFTGCATIAELNITVHLPPQLNQTNQVNYCETTDNTIDLSLINQQIVDDPFGLTFSYHATEQDASNNNNPLNNVYTYTNTTEQIYARVEFNETGCFDTKPVEIIIDPNPTAFPVPTIRTCTNDYEYPFNLTEQNSNVLGNQNPNDFMVTYHHSEADANQANNAIEQTNNYNAVSGEVIYTRIENRNTGCFDTGSFQILLDPIPVIPIQNQQVFCLENLSITIDARTGLPNETYQWSNGATTPNTIITEPGDYWVTVTSERGCQATQNFSIIDASPISIVSIDFENFTDSQDVIVNATGGSGSFLYVIDDGNSQESNIFEDVVFGRHVVTVLDQNGCQPVSEPFTVVNYPKFFTPNGDGINDTWHIIGVNLLPGTGISIFDRFGKLLKQISSETEGWDGTYNGKPMPSSDYWFIATGEDENGPFEITGHFSIKR